MLEVKERIERNLRAITKQMGVTRDIVLVEIPTDTTHGDLTSNIAMQISKELKSNPMDIANDIVKGYPQDDEDIERVEVVNPGFLNFFLSEKYLLKMLNDISQNEDYFNLDMLKGRRYMIEYTDPNPFKILHIGHLYTNMVGESFACLLEALGASVIRANYQGDVGLHVAKTIWGLMEMLKDDNISFEVVSKKDLEQRVRYLGDAYMLGFQMYDDVKDEKVIQMVKDINYYIFSLHIPSLPKKEFSFNTQEVSEMYTQGREWCLEYFERIYQRTGTKFDKYYFESEMGKKGMDIVMANVDNKGKNIFKRSEGAVVYEGDEGKGLHTRVFVNKEGLPTYEAKELALQIDKCEDTNLDESITITADEQTSYFKVVFDALSHIVPEVASRSKHIPHGMVKLPGAEKMSSRKGKIIEGEWLLDETKKRVEEIMLSSGKWSKQDISSISEGISMAAIKYAFVKVTVGKDVVFDFDKSITFDGDTGPYLLYVYARCRSILQEAGNVKDTNQDVKMDGYSKELLRAISRYRQVLIAASLNYSPSTLCTYLFELSQTFNSFYQNVRVLDSSNQEFLLKVVDSTSKTVKHGLDSLGINIVERM